MAENMFRRCSRCGLVLPEEAFGWRDRARTRRQTYCRPCFAAYHREWYGRHRDAQIARVNQRRSERLQHHRSVVREAKSVPCSDCGGVFDPCAMDFDHVRDRKKGTISEMVYSSTTAALLAEIAKCDVVCANCHRARTQRRSGAKR